MKKNAPIVVIKPMIQPCNIDFNLYDSSSYAIEEECGALCRAVFTRGGAGFSIAFIMSLLSRDAVSEDRLLRNKPIIATRREMPPMSIAASLMRISDR